MVGLDSVVSRLALTPSLINFVTDSRLTSMTYGIIIKQLFMIELDLFTLIAIHMNGCDYCDFLAWIRAITILYGTSKGNL